MKMEPTESSETSAFSTWTPGRYPKENALHMEVKKSTGDEILLLKSKFDNYFNPSSSTRAANFAVMIGQTPEVAVTIC
jgi:hypothetical protein